ncbi:NANOS2 [Lepeophtheirus salmonis]|uniref:NANOS2 n=1 Tax=Lepeophtheirus salmonis TaxID=72036 RepID=A0A7R8CFA2_LEPSM|nr:NANOS2 [Lepeophtheirus salmonis]CAF2758790.1 NANOS2 [Lepeophtheirus salmonis]
MCYILPKKSTSWGQSFGTSMMQPPPFHSTLLKDSSFKSCCTIGGGECNFCRNNGESQEHYRSHALRNQTTGTLVCPILRSYRCDTCGATGDNAHTRNYCPMRDSRRRAPSNGTEVYNATE